MAFLKGRRMKLRTLLTLQTIYGLRDFSSIKIWFIAWGINLFGTTWNIIAAVGAFEFPNSENFVRN